MIQIVTLKCRRVVKIKESLKPSHSLHTCVVLGNKSTFSLLKLLDFKIGKKMLREMVSTAHTHTPCLMKIAGVEAITA